MPVQTSNKLEDYNLTDTETFSEFERQTKEMVTFDKRLDAFWFAQLIESLLKDKPEARSDSEVAERYKKLIIMNKWVALNLLSNSEIIELFRNNFKEALEMEEYSVWDQLRAKLIGMLVYEERDKLKAEIKEALEKNQQKIAPLAILVGEERVAPTIGNWLRSYIKFMGTGPVDRLKQSEFFSSNKDMQAIDLVSREKMMRLFNFYERIKLSSLTIEGLEETILIPEGPNGESGGIIRNGKFEPISGKEYKDFARLMSVDNKEPVAPAENPNNLDEAGNITKIYQGTADEEAEIEAIQVGIRKNIEGVEEKIKDLVYENIVPQNTAQPVDGKKIIASLRVAAEVGKIDELLGEENFRALFVEYLQRRNKFQDVEKFKMDPSDGAYFIMFLRFILEEKVGLDANESARVGMQIINIMKKVGNARYANSVYFDEAMGKFEWV